MVKYCQHPNISELVVLINDLDPKEFYEANAAICEGLLRLAKTQKSHLNISITVSELTRPG